MRGVEFTWHAGLSLAQKRRSAASLRDAILAAGLAVSPLEISTRSSEAVGVRLSAFNLRLQGSGWPGCPVECAFQASKVFAGGGPYLDIQRMAPAEAKRDPRLRSSGDLTGFAFGGERWGLVPRTALYDWLYVNALAQNPDLAAAVRGRDAFTDIEFNPRRSLNCQARSAALFVALDRFALLPRALNALEDFREIAGQADDAGPGAGRLAAWP